jgi:PRTRC genetic system ThiF family protein
MRYHYLEQYIASAQHKITVNLIGCGGTGSHMLTNLATLSHAFVKLGKQSLFVRVFDPDIVEDFNCGRQMFSVSDVGRFKSDVLVERCNRYFGTDWISVPELFGGESDMKDHSRHANFVISCVDSVKSRKMIDSMYPAKVRDKSGDGYYRESYNTSFYWMDIGNAKKTGQIILGTLRPIKQPTKYLSNLPCFFEEYPKVKEQNQLPSCSLAESLWKQDLFINKIMATFASNMLWQLLMEFRINYRGIYINLESLKTQPIAL